MAIKILTIDDHPLIRHGIRALLEEHPQFELVGEAADAMSGIELHRRLCPDITLMDLQMPGMDGISATQVLMREQPQARVVILTTFRGDAHARDAIQAGAAGFLLKSELGGQLVDALLRIHQGRRCFSPEVSREIAEHTGFEAITQRERAILGALARGWENKRIANGLGVSAETVKSHVGRILGKLRARNRTEAIQIARRRGFIRSLD